MKLKTTLLAALGCLFALATSCKDPDDNNKTQYVTNKAGERLVEKISSIYTHDDYNDTIFEHLFYNSDGSLKTIARNYTDEDRYSRIYSFERKNTTLYMRDEERYLVDSELQEIINETSFDLNENGLIILDRGWEGNNNYRLTYDESGKYLHNIFDGDEVVRSFQWEDGNIFNEEVTYIPQAHSSNMDWSEYFHTWSHYNAENEILHNIPCISLFWGFSEGFLGNKCQGVPAEDGECNYTYEFTKDGFISAIYLTKKSNGKTASVHRIYYLKK